ncbi:MAG: hypothetical protein ABSE41_15905 [Bacteroidota bacterium]
MKDSTLARFSGTGFAQPDARAGQRREVITRDLLGLTSIKK